MDDFGVPLFLEIPIYKSATSSREKRWLAQKVSVYFYVYKSFKLSANKFKICTIRATGVFPYVIIGKCANRMLWDISFLGTLWLAWSSFPEDPDMS